MNWQTVRQGLAGHHDDRFRILHRRAHKQGNTLGRFRTPDPGQRRPRWAADSCSASPSGTSGQPRRCAGKVAAVRRDREPRRPEARQSGLAVGVDRVGRFALLGQPVAMLAQLLRGDVVGLAAARVRIGFGRRAGGVAAPDEPLGEVIGGTFRCGPCGLQDLHELCASMCLTESVHCGRHDKPGSEIALHTVTPARTVGAHGPCLFAPNMGALGCR